MAGAFEESFRTGSKAAVIIGGDCPSLTPEVIMAAFARLAENPVVLGPAQDGGYYLIGLSRPMPELFRGIPWGTDRVLADSLAVLQRRGCKPSLLEPLQDIDRPEDLCAWHRIAAPEDSCLDRVSVIIPALNEESTITTTLRAVGRSPCHEVIVVDGGSTDATVQRARDAGANVRISRPGRARQINAGAAAAEGGSLLFVHADTLLPPGLPGMVARTLGTPAWPRAPFASASPGALPASRSLSGSLASAHGSSSDPTATRGFSSQDPCLRKWEASLTCRSWRIMNSQPACAGADGLSRCAKPP
jgi:hypothetical protein